MDHVRRGFVVATAVTVTVLVAGCSAGRPAHRSWQAPVDEPTAGAPLGNQVDGLDSAAILQRAQAATAGASSVHVKGELVTPGTTKAPAKPFSVDMRFTSTGSEGRIVEDGTTAYMTRVQSQVWFRGDAGFWGKVGGSSSAVAYTDRYVQVPAQEKKYDGIIENTYVERLTNKLMGKPGKLEKGATKTVNGHKAIALENRTPGAGGTIWVATEGAPYLLRMEAAADAKQTGAFDFLAYGERVDVHAPEPKDVVDKDLTSGSSGSSSPSTGSSNSSGSAKGSTGTPSSSGGSSTRRPDIGRGSKPPVPSGLKHEPLLFP
ncbi:hypothetical protein [Streptomyces sp. SID3343]|uniref:hypothetical protein n=1 Tax=Streptomyces sp. SID3343 TaxID=2690260 RepID=UPI001370D12A|nr:hypothetical protein [Streptomyces sp. SID3343]MYW02105.1 hypothetical protein [Streptomyces sp. SID3343]